MAKRETTGEAIAKARASIAAARIADPDEHFPYKLGAVHAVLDDAPAMGPGGPDDDRVLPEDFMTARIADASDAVVAAQERMLTDPTPGNRSAYEAAKDDLIAARRNHRRNRVDEDGNPVGAVVALTKAAPPAHQVGPRLRRVGED